MSFGFQALCSLAYHNRSCQLCGLSDSYMALFSSSRWSNFPEIPTPSMDTHWLTVRDLSSSNILLLGFCLSSLVMGPLSLGKVLLVSPQSVVPVTAKPARGLQRMCVFQKMSTYSLLLPLTQGPLAEGATYPFFSAVFPLPNPSPHIPPHRALIPHGLTSWSPKVMNLR